jgi:hypothetical protein
MEVVEDFFYEVQAKMVLEGGGEIDIGGNASAEGGGEEDEDAPTPVVDVVASGRLQETNFGKKDFVAVFKGWIKVRLTHFTSPTSRSPPQKTKPFLLPGSPRMYSW